jgi:hypothetical protein
LGRISLSKAKEGLVEKLLDNLLLVDTHKKAIMRIKWGGGVALLCAFMTLFVAIAGERGLLDIYGFDLWNLVDVLDIYGFDLWNLVDVFILVLLAVGVFLKNRVAAVLLVVYWIISKGWKWSEYGIPDSTIAFLLPLLVLYAFVEGLSGAYSYHKLKASEKLFSEFPPA